MQRPTLQHAQDRQFRRSPFQFRPYHPYLRLLHVRVLYNRSGMSIVLVPRQIRIVTLRSVFGDEGIATTATCYPNKPISRTTGTKNTFSASRQTLLNPHSIPRRSFPAPHPPSTLPPFCRSRGAAASWSRQTVPDTSSPAASQSPAPRAWTAPPSDP